MVDFWICVLFPVFLLIGATGGTIALYLAAQWCEARARILEAEIQGHLDTALSCALEAPATVPEQQRLYRAWEAWERSQATRKRATADSFWVAADLFSRD